jgi:serine/threonine protein kinase
MVHRLMDTVFSGAELDEFCARYYPDLCIEFGPDMDSVTKVQRLIEHAAHQGGLGQLVAKVEQARPEAYRHFVARVQQPGPPAAADRPAPITSTLPRTPEGLVRHLLAGRYRIDEMLDKGGVGAVFKAFDTKLELEVAIKVIDLKRVKQPTIRERVQQEVQTAMKLDHPGIVRIYDFGQDGPFIYILMEFITGYNLQEAHRRFKALDRSTFLPPVMQLMQQICEIVDYLHQQGVLHPSLRPDNIMLKPGQTAGEQTWQPVLINLGLLRPNRDALRTGEDIPTEQLIYSVSPELLLGHTTDIRSDVYALGIVLYELVTGRPPFEPRNLAEAVQMHVQEPPPAPRTMDPKVPETLERIILKALAKDPADRYLSARGMAQALADTITGSGRAGLARRAELALLTDARPLVVTPGDNLPISLVITNNGDREERPQIKVQGVPPEWVEISPAVTALKPGEEVEVQVMIQPPRSSLSRAGRHPVTIQVAGQRSPRQLDEIRRVLTVAPYVQFDSTLWPREIDSGQTVQVTVENLGNVTETFIVQARPEEELLFEPDQTRLKLGAGQSGAVDMEVGFHRRRWIGEVRTQTFSIQVSSPYSPPMVHTGEVTSRSVLTTRWVLAIVLLIFLFLCAVAAFYPIINPSPEDVIVTANLLTSEAISRQATFQAATAQVLNAQTATVVAAARETAQLQAGAAQAATATVAWLAGDDDRDGLTNGQELSFGTLPDIRDTDRDGLDDSAEVNQFRTSPLNPDTDYDGKLDGEEVRLGLSPIFRDTDNDGTPDSVDDDPGRVPTPTATVTPNPTATRVPGVRFSGSSFIADEREGEAIITVILDAPAGEQVMVDYSTSNGTAEAGGDYRTTIGTLVFDPGQTSQRFTVPVLNDTVDETEELVYLNLSNPRGGMLGSVSQATLTILDDDEPISIRFSQGSRLLGVFVTGPGPVYEVDESQGRAIIDVVLSAPANQAIRVDYTTNDATAIAGQDYSLTRGTLFFDPGINRRTFEVVIVNDFMPEVDEIIVLTLSNAIGARIDTPRAELVIDDDD